MPNWITVEIKAKPEILDSLASENSVVDLNNMVPMPDTVYKGPLSSNAEPGTPQHIFSTDDVLNWYGWSIKYWGTKWNVNGTHAKRESEDTVRFETAWSHPFMAIVALSRKYPNDEIEVSFADEDIGSDNCGSYVIMNGEIIDHTTPENDFEFASQLIYGVSYEELEAMYEEVADAN